jgi:Fuc2NAc and GlcNAc transferase
MIEGYDRIATFDAKAHLNIIDIFLFVVVITTFVAWIATGCVRSLAIRHAILDVPNIRSSHKVPVPRGGGLAIAVVFVGALICLAASHVLNPLLFAAFSIGSGAVAVVGYADDLRPLSSRFRLCVHIGASVVFVFILDVFLHDRSSFSSTFTFWMGEGILVFLLSSAVNVFNFMDGIDGIAGSEAVYFAGAGAWLNWYVMGDSGLTLTMLCLASATAGFLFWNMPPARIFMGDVGSGFLGFMLAALGIVTSLVSAIPAQVWAILGGVFLVDASITLLRRFARGDRWFEAHRTHAYQHLAVRWRGHLPVTVLVSVVNICWLFPWAFYAVLVPERSNICLVLSLLPLVILVSIAGAGKA